MAQSDWAVVGAAGPPPVVGAVQAPLSPQIEEEEVGLALPPPTAVAGPPGTEGALLPSTLVAAAAA